MESIKRNVSRLEMPGAVAEAEGDVLVAPLEAAAAAAAVVLVLLVAESDTTRCAAFKIAPPPLSFKSPKSA